MNYSEKLEALRTEVLEQLRRQVPTKHDWVDLLDEDDTGNREVIPLVNFRWKHYAYTSEYAIKIEFGEEEPMGVFEDIESGDWNTRPLSWLSTSELCEILDLAIEKIK